jgi:hypothetical protein
MHFTAMYIAARYWIIEKQNLWLRNFFPERLRNVPKYLIFVASTYPNFPPLKIVFVANKRFTSH